MSQIVGPSGHYLRFEFVEIDLPYSYNCSTTDHVYVQEANISATTIDDHLAQLAHRLNEHGAENPVSGPYCGDGINAPYGEEANNTSVVADSFGNEAYLVFKSDGYDQGKTGFIVRINASVEGTLVVPLNFNTFMQIMGICRMRRLDRGQLWDLEKSRLSHWISSSPLLQLDHTVSTSNSLYSLRTATVIFFYNITLLNSGPEFRSVRLEFTDFDLEPGTVYTRSDNTTYTYCRYDYIYVSSQTRKSLSEVLNVLLLFECQADER